MGLINKVDMVCLSPVGYGVLADVSSVSPSSEHDLRRCLELLQVQSFDDFVENCNY